MSRAITFGREQRLSNIAHFEKVGAYWPPLRKFSGGQHVQLADVPVPVWASHRYRVALSGVTQFDEAAELARRELHFADVRSPDGPAVAPSVR